MKVIHILADGQQVENIEGMIIPNTGATTAVYRIIADFAAKHPEVQHVKTERTKEAIA